MEQPDQYHGMGGSYVVDPTTGRRVPQAEWDAQQAAKGAPSADKPRTDRSRGSVTDKE